jgi:hypothetical protein
VQVEPILDRHMVRVHVTERRARCRTR